MYTVDTTIDELDGSCVDGDCSLRDAISLANIDVAADTINIPSGTYTLTLLAAGNENEDLNVQDDLDVIYPVTITGAGEALTIITSNTGNSTSQRYRIFQFMTTAAGSILSDMKIQNGGNAFSTLNGAGIYSSGSINISNTTFTNNKTGGFGAALYTTGGILSNVNVDGNTAKFSGAGIYNVTNLLTINTGSTFNNNYATSYTNASSLGGVIYSTGNVAIVNSTFTGRANDAYLGGAIYMSGANLDITNSSFSGFKASNNGGVIYAAGGTFTDVTITGNFASGSGGAIYNITNPLTINGTLNTFTNNRTTASATRLGGHIYSSANLIISNTDFNGLAGTNDSYRGGAIYAAADLTLSDSSFDEFDTNNTSGAVHMTGGTLTNVAFNNNYATCLGGAVNNSVNPLVINGTTTFSGNKISTNVGCFGGSIYSTALVTVSDAVFTDSDGTNDARSGGAIYSTTTLNLSNTSFDSFETWASGGAVYSFGGTFSDVTFTNNSSSDQAGAIHNDTNLLTINGTANTFSGNYGTNSGSYGGTIHSTGALTISNTAFTGRGVVDAQWGGALAMTTGNTLTILDSSFTNFQSAWNGGAIHMFGGTFTNVSFTNNKSAQDGGGAIFNQTNLLTINGTSNAFVNNDTSGNASDNGGAIATTGNLDISKTSFTNSLAYVGGAIYGTAASTITVNQSSLSTNTSNGSATDGGAIYSLGTLNVYNSTLSANSAVDQGGAIFATTCSILNSTFYNNVATTGRAIAGSACTMQNSVVSETATTTSLCTGVTSSGYNIHHDGDGLNTDNAECFTHTTGDQNIDPLLTTIIDLNGVHTLQTGSPAIDSGLNATCTGVNVNSVDQIGTARPINVTCDIGAYEYTGITTVVEGTVYTDEGLTNIGANKTIRLVVNGVLQGTVLTNVLGQYSFSQALTAGDNILVYIEGETTDGTSVTVSDGASLSTLDVYANRLIVRHDNAGVMTNALLNAADGVGGNAEILYTMVGTALTVTATTELFIPTGHTFTPGNTIDSIGMDINGTLNAAANAINVSGSWDATGGVFTSTGTVTFDAIAGTNNIIPGGVDVNHDFQNIIFNDAAGTATFLLGGAIDVDGNVTVTDGIFDSSVTNYAITVGGNVSQAAIGQIEARASTLTVAGNVSISGAIDNTDYNSSTLILNSATADQTLTTSGAMLNNLTLNNTGPNGTADNLIIADALDTNGVLTITDGDLDLSTNDPNINTAGNIIIGASGSTDVSAYTGTWTIDGTSTLTDNTGVQDFETLVVNSTGALTLASNAKVKSLNINASGSVNLASYILTIDGTGTPLVNGGTFTAGTSTVKYTGTTTATNITNLAYSSLQLTPSLATTYSLTATTTLTGNLTIDANATLDATASNFGLTAVNMTNAGTYLAKGSAINVSGNWANSGTFTAATSTVTFNGTGVQSVTSGGGAFTNLTVTNATAVVTFADAFTTTNFTAITPSTQLTFTGALTYTISGTLNLNGQATGTKVLLRSTAASQYILDVTGGAQAVSFVDVQYSAASSFDIKASNSTDSGNNDNLAATPHWIFADLNVCSTCSYTTIQAAINASVSGDTIHVSAGTYNENIDFVGKNVTVKSVSGAVSTLIRGTLGYNNNPVVKFISGETASAVLDGFTIDNNTANASQTRGITIVSSSPTIQNCIIDGNQAYFATPGFGAGMHISGTGGATLINTAITNNSTGGSGETGGGIYNTGTGTLSITGGSVSFNTANKGGGGIFQSAGTLTINGTTIASNTSGGGGIGGGGINYSSSGALTITNATIESNSVPLGGDGGGGLWLESATATITGTTFRSNSTAGFLGGGGIMVRGTAPSLTLSKSHVLGSISNNSNNSADGGGIKIATGTATITNTVIAGNVNTVAAQADGGGIYVGPTATLNLYFSTVADNYTVRNGGGVNGDGVENIYNSIIYGNLNSGGVSETFGTIDVLYLSSTTNPAFVTNSPATGGIPTTNGNYNIQASSNAKDTGDGTNAPADDIVGTARPVNIIYDKGAYEFILGANTAPIGGYTANNVIPSAQVVQATNGSGLLTINWKAVDVDGNNVTLKTFEYSVDGGATWNAPTNADASAALSANWTNNGSSWSSATTFGAATAHSFTFNTQHADTAGLAGVDQADVQVRFLVNDGTVDSALPATSASVQVDNVTPTTTITSAAYSSATDTMVITGTNFLTIAAATTDIKAYVDWTKFIWDINGDNGVTTDIPAFTLATHITSLTVTNGTTLTLVFKAAGGTLIEGTAGFGTTGGADTLDVAAGFSKDIFGNVSTTDAKANAAIATNTAPIGGYTANNVIPLAQVVQATNGSGLLTINWKAVDVDGNNVTLKTFEYSVDGGATWNAP
ncbi:MAG: CSLREA domain-containing protein, partial [Gammaproteobacteria bacterium]|nr:CSLREA domain-containing protein [Gammaproteobacteria bacterium]